MQRSNLRTLRQKEPGGTNMDNIYSLLDLNADLFSNFTFQANLIEDKGTERILNQNIKKLEQIDRIHGADVACKTPVHTINAVIQKVLRKALKDSEEDVSLPELRIISYNLSQFHGDDKAYFYALSLLENEWRDMFFNGISSYLLSSWNHIRKDYLSKCINLFTSKLQSYSGRIQRYQKLKENSDFFQENGPLRLGALIARKNVPLKEAPLLLGYKQSAFAHPYFSDVIIKFIKDTNFSDVDFLEDEIFAYHKEDRTKKLVFANLVLAAEAHGDTFRQRKISSTARRILGDITLSATWAPFQGATDEEISNLRRASELVNLWVNRLVIEAFFEVCVQEKSRERFWIDYAKEVTGFKIAGSSLVRRMLQQDPRIDSQTLNKCFIETSSNLSRTSALILVFRGKAVVEFSDIGSIYAYNVTNSVISSLLRNRRRIDKIDELKDTSLPILVESQGYYSWLQEEGRLTHRGEWETRLRTWLREKVFVSSNIDPYVHTINEVFKYQPISYEQPKLYDQPQTKNPEVREYSLFEDEESLNKDIRLDNYSESNERNRTTSGNKNPEKKGSNEQTQKNVTESIWTPLDSASLVSSKWIFDGLCQVVGTLDGFYLHIVTKETNRYAKIKEYKINSTNKGNIWIKKPTGKNWYPIVYFVNGQEYSVGLIKFSKERVLYRISVDRPDCKIYPIE